MRTGLLVRHCLLSYRMGATSGQCKFIGGEQRQSLTDLGDRRLADDQWSLFRHLVVCGRFARLMMNRRDINTVRALKHGSTKSRETARTRETKQIFASSICSRMKRARVQGKLKECLTVNLILDVLCLSYTVQSQTPTIETEMLLFMPFMPRLSHAASRSSHQLHSPTFPIRTRPVQYPQKVRPQSQLPSQQAR